MSRKALLMIIVIIMIVSSFSNVVDIIDNKPRIIAFQERSNETIIFDSKAYNKEFSVKKAYSGIEVVVDTIETIQSIPSNWHNLTYRYRLPVYINESAGIERQNELVTVKLTFDYGIAYNNSLRVINNATGNIVMFQVWNATYYSDTSYYQTAYISWLVSLNPYESKLYYIYWSDVDIGSMPDFTSDLTFLDTAGYIKVSNSYYDVQIDKVGSLGFFVNGQELSSFNAFSPTPFVAHPYNATYVIVDRANDTSYGNADHLKIIAWEDNTYVELYGFNSDTGTFEYIANRTLSKNQMWRYPDEGPIYTYTVIKVVSDKPVTIIAGDLGTQMTDDAYGDEATTRIQWGVDHGSDDDLYTYYGQDIVLWVPRDLWISAYFDNTHIKIIDISDGDDNYEFTLNANEHWLLFYGINITPYNLDTKYYFDNDIVRIIADKPITIVGGYLDDNIYGEVRGFAQKRFVFPVFRDFALCALEDNTHINIWVKNLYNGTEWIWNITLNRGEGKQFTGLTNLADNTNGKWGYIGLDEMAKAIVTADKPIVVFTGADRSSGGTWGGEGEYVGEFFAYISTYKPRYVKAVALEPNTTVEIYLNGTYGGSQTLSNVGDSYTWQIQAGEGVIIKSNKPVVTKTFGGWDQQVPSEDVFLLVNMLPMRVGSWELITAGPVLVGVKVHWEIQQFLEVEDTYIFIASNPAILFQRKFSKPDLMDINGSLILIDLNIKNIFDYQNVLGTTYTATYQKWLYNNTELYASYWNETTNLSIGIGINDMGIIGNGRISYVGGISGWFKETTSVHLILGWNTSIYLEGGAQNYLRIIGFLLLGQFGSNIDSITQNVFQEIENPAIIDIKPRESSLCKVIIEATSDDPTPLPVGNVKLNLTSTRHALLLSGLTNISGYYEFVDVPASDDYILSVFWINDTSVFNVFPVANTSLSLQVLGSIKVKIRIKVRALTIHINNVDGKPLSNAAIWVYGFYGTELIVNSTKFMSQSGTVLLSNMPLGTESTPVNYTIKVWYNTQSTLEPIELANSTLVSWNNTPIEQSATIIIPVTILRVKVIARSGEGIPGASVAIRNGTLGDIFASKSTDMTNSTTFEDIPIGYGYLFEVRYAGYVNSSYQTNVLSEMNVTIVLPLTYGQTPLLIFFDKKEYSATLGATLRIFIKIYGNYTNETTWYLEPVEPDAISLDVVNATNISDYRIQNAIPNGLGNGTYYYDLYISEDLFGNGGDYLIKVHVEKIAFKPGDNSSLLHVNIPISTKVEDYGYKHEYWGANYTVWIKLSDKSTGDPIVDAEVRAQILSDTTVYRTLNLSHIENGTYKAFTILDGNITPGVYTVNITINRSGIESFWVAFPLTVDPVPTDHIATIQTPVGFYENVTAYVTFMRTDPNRVFTYVSGATVTFYIENATTGERVYPLTGVLHGKEVETGKYLITFNASLLGAEGSYRLIVNITKEYYVNITGIRLLFDVVPMKTRAVPLASSISVEYGDNVTLEISYETEAGTPIPNANVELRISNVTFNYNVIYNATSSKYIITFNTNQSGFDIGSYSVEAIFSREHFENASTVITLNIIPIRTKLLSVATEYRVYFGDNATLKFSYLTLRDRIVTDAIYTMRIEGVPSFVYSSYYNESSGEYVFVIPTNQSAFNIGTYVVNVTFSKHYYETQTIVVKMVIEPIPTKAIPNANEFVVYYGKKVTIVVNYITIWDESILGANVNVSVSGLGLISALIYYNESLGAYVIVFNVTEVGLTENTYIVSIGLSKTYYRSQLVNVKLTVIPIDTMISYQRSYSVFIDENLTIPITYFDNVNGVYIKNATLNFTIEDLNYNVLYTGSVTSDNGTYIIRITAFSLEPGLYRIYFNISKEHYAEKSGQITIAITKVKITVAYESSLNITWGENTTLIYNVISERGEHVPNILVSAVIMDEQWNAIATLPSSFEGNGKFVVYLDTWNLTPGATYYLNVTFGSNVYTETSAITTVYVGYVEVSVKVGVKELKIEKNPVTGSATTTITISVYTYNNIPAIGAKILYKLYKGKTLVETGMFEEVNPELSPGVYRAVIDWSNKAPGSYSIKIVIQELSIRGQTVNATKIVAPGTEGVHVPVEVIANVDYYGGSVEIAGNRYPSILVFSGVGVLMAIIGYIVYWYFTWVILPPEVKEIIKLLKMLEKGIFEYKAPARKDYIDKLIREELGIG